MPDIRSTTILQPRGYYRMPAGAIADTYDRSLITTSSATAQVTAILHLYEIELRAGLIVANFNIRTGGTGLSTGTNEWAGLYDSARVQLAVSADQALASMAALTTFTWPVATTAAGAASSYTVPTTGLYYFGLMLKATTVCTLVTYAISGQTLAPITAGSADTAQAGVNAFPFTAAALTPTASYPYLWLS